jgi:hypothetical protein
MTRWEQMGTVSPGYPYTRVHRSFTEKPFPSVPAVYDRTRQNPLWDRLIRLRCGSGRSNDAAEEDDR